MTISFVGAQANAGTTVTIPTHQSGDFILIFAFRDGSTSQPTVPAAGGTVPAWTGIATGGSNLCSARLSYTVATASTTTSGTWTNATELVCMVYRGAKVPGAFVAGSGASTTISYPALTLNRTDGSSWVVGVAGHRSATNVEVAPTGMTNRASTGTEAAGHDTNGTVSSWSQQTVTVNANSGWRSWTVELRDATVVLVANKGTFTETGLDATLVKQRRLVAEKGTFTHTGQDATLRHTVILVAERRVFTADGNPAGTLAARVLVAASGSISFVGKNADLHYVAGIDINGDPGPFVVTGKDAQLRRGYILSAATRAFNVVGKDAALIYTPASSDKPFYYQTIETDPRKIIISAGSGDQLVYYVNPYLRIL